jgi:peptidoglycan DL-endopeptidase CwlO
MRPGVVVRPSGGLRRWTPRVGLSRMSESSIALFECRRHARFARAAAVVLAVGCAGRREASDFPSVAFATMPNPTEGRPSSPDGVDAVLAAAGDTLGVSSPRLDGNAVPTDCSGYLHALYERAHVDLFSESRPGDNGVRAIVRWVQRYGHLFRAELAAPGDLVFFDNSYDRDGDRRLNDRLTHAGLVEQLLPDGTLLIVHATNHGIVREPMNLLRRHEATDAAGRATNAPLRRRGTGDGPNTPHLMSELFAGFGSVFQRGSLAESGR